MNTRSFVSGFALAGMLAMAGVAQAYSITVDANAADWTLTALHANTKMGQLGRNSSNQGVYSWNDPTGDDTSASNANSDIDYLHITADSSYLYVLVKMVNITDLADQGGPILQIAVDTDQTRYGGNSYFCENTSNAATHRTSPDAEWEYLISAVPGESQFFVRGYRSCGVTSLSSTCTSTSSYCRASTSTDLFEMRVPWSNLGGAPDGPLRFTVLSVIAKNNGGFDANGSDDVVTNNGHPTAGGNTATELADGDIDYYFDVWFIDFDDEPAPPLTISEIYRGAAQANQWVEIYNRSGQDIFLSGWEIGDEETIGSTEGMHTFPATAEIPGGHAQVVAYSGTTFNSTYSAYPNYEISSAAPLVPDMGDDTSWGSGNMNLGTPDEVLLLDGSYTVVDKVSYTLAATNAALYRSRVYRDTDSAAPGTDFGTHTQGVTNPNPGVGDGICVDHAGSATALNTEPCNSGDLCLTQTCSAGTCSGSTSRTCPTDNNECTSDACDAAYLGCGYPPLGDTVDCTDTTPTDCKQAECDGAGACDQNGGNESAGTACPDTTPNDCKTAACNGTGTCNQTYGNEANGDPCTDTTATDCKAACCQAGVCEQSFAGCDEPAGTVCPDTTPNNCGQPRCNATGTCNQTALPELNTYECRTAGDPNEPCDVAEFCDGASTVCPADGVASGTVCHVAVGLCDLAEVCDGVLKTCPFDEVAASGTVCHPNGGPCDIEEVCDGILKDCPTDEVIASGTRCHTASAVCDADDYCDGVAKACADAKQPTSFECRESFGICDPAEFCDGINNACPSDAKSTSVCGPSTNPCDLEELCDGVNNACPVDEFASPGAPCDDLDPCIENTTCDSFGNCTGGIRVCIDAGVLPDAAEPDTLIPDASAPDTSLPDLGPEDTFGTDLARPDAGAADWSQPDTNRPDTSGTDMVWVDAAGSDRAGADAGVAEDGPAVLDATTRTDAVITGPPLAPPIESAPGCACAASGAGRSPTALLLALITFGLVRRRRR